METISAASHQWRTRPDDQRYTSMDELAAAADNRKKERNRMSKHTPGPWRSSMTIEESRKRFVADIWQGADDGPCIATVEGDDQDRVQANARLIADAPELLAALRDTLDALYNETPNDDDDSYLSQVKKTARAAIAKAEGSAD